MVPDNPHELIVEVDSEDSIAKVREEIRAYRAGIKKKIRNKNYIVVKLPEDQDKEEWRAWLAALPEVRRVEDNQQTRMLQNTPPGYSHDQLWNLSMCRLPMAWEYETGNLDLSVAILDTGIDDGHEALSHLVDTEKSASFVDGEPDIYDYHGHGTHVAGTAAADNGDGFVGAMWEASLVAIKVMDEDGTGYLDWLIDGIEHAIDEDVDIINMSLGYDQMSPSVRSAIQDAYDAGIVLVAAAGNADQGEDAEDKAAYPARHDEVIGVIAAEDQPSGPQKADYSFYGDGCDVIAPGSDIYSTYPGDSYGTGTGTSMAAPMVAGAAGLLLAYGYPADEVRGMLHRTAMNIYDTDEDGFHEKQAYGLVNAYWAVVDVQYIHIILGEKQGEDLVPHYWQSLDIGDREFVLQDIPPFEYDLVAWVETGKEYIRPADYLAEASIDLSEGDHGLDLTLQEVTN